MATKKTTTQELNVSLLMLLNYNVYTLSMIWECCLKIFKMYIISQAKKTKVWL